MSSRIAGILMCGLTLTPLAGCHLGPTFSLEPSPVRQAPTVEQLVVRYPVDVVHTRTGGFLIRIRGSATLLGRQAPLYVVDGNPVEIDPRVGIDWLQPKDIARIEVLRNPTETASWGPRGVDGVVVITTMRNR